jgi:hypothetical protein
VFNIVERRVMITLRSPEVPAGWSAVPHYEPVVADAHTPIPKAAPPQLVSYAFHMPQLLDAWLTGLAHLFRRPAAPLPQEILA